MRMVPGDIRVASSYVTRLERATSALAAFGVVLLIVVALLFGLRVVRNAPSPGALISIDFKPTPPEAKRPKPQVRRLKARAAKDAPSPPNLKNKATQVVALPVPPLIVPPPIVVATQAGAGAADSTGAADRPGHGQGAGGVGDGSGGGGYGGGTGDGNGARSGPRRIRGRLSFADLPDGLLGAGMTATVGVRYRVNTNGHVSDCQVDQASGISALDTLTCRLIQQRFRFRPARNRAGRPVRSIIVETHTWVAEAEEQLGRRE